MSLYVPLWCKSNFSFLEGASHPDELVDEAYRLGLPAIALTDRDGVYGVVRAHVKAREVGMKLIVGAELTVEDGSTIALLSAGPRRLRQSLQADHQRPVALGEGRERGHWDEVCAHAPGLIALWGGERENLDSGVRRNDNKGSRVGSAKRETDAEQVVGNLRDAFADRLYGLIARHRREEEIVSGSAARASARRASAFLWPPPTRCSITRRRGAVCRMC